MAGESFVRHFRESSPYIHRFRGQIFVINFGGDAIADGSVAGIAQDLALLNSLGVSLVLVHGAGPQIDAALARHGLESQRVGGQRITTAAIMAALREAVGGARLEVEAILSEGRLDSPMAHAGLEVIGGNFIIARPLGILDGVDYQYTGAVRRVAVETMRRHLDADEVILLSPVGVSPTGTLFNIRAEDVAVAAASALGAAKLIFYTDAPGVVDAAGQLTRQITLSEIDGFLDIPQADPAVLEHLHSARRVCSAGVDRVHLIPRRVDGALLRELFTRDGLGTMISRDPFEHLRGARLEDIPGILALIRPMEAAGILVRRSRERLEQEIDRFIVMERDGKIIACVALYPYPEFSMAEMACLAVDDAYRRQGRGEALLEYCLLQARQQGLRRLFVLSTQSSHWFLERAFQRADISDLPMPRQALYNLQRRSAVFIRSVDET
ncbi:MULTISPECIES: amino-acid N-acetyltransferase [Acidithiobacillus]|jgi:amino-acid N-acetyltransferase|uniref:Amino-acid acetyltransferase n=5 Tax=Acidithiobacillus caldus TaxID=33059 RepID=F9ZLY5_ACICS|nr:MULTISPECIES: amino-acid N-acetyltransferase [Acidithiobacillus]AEK57467.1 N-acetylglutamate synthase [Acidithiobacillus caldus SM-1]AIA54678.1 N-acetylglutamate synthase [Acidithiobacillus caldus ATCC 51756]AUW32180.1 amino-acid N-acetyltransferase [Acidithiobacillus caldus]MBU2731024.1 amino-acid N-acetyltransferase [Acidithiobacillus caldus]MBU2735007.1 amino-acid N-acetyltransferase [Acidithiobacillus caldus ATCC 51756]